MASNYDLYDAENKKIDLGNLENRAAWYESGVSGENVFVKKFGAKLNVEINPSKDTNPCALDLLWKGHPAELKCQMTPLFTAQSRYKTDPQYAVTFNLKDALNYGPWGKNYADIQIFFWVHWVAVKMVMGERIYQVKPLQGVWSIAYNKLEKLRQNYPIHWYYRREKDYEPNINFAQTLKKFEPRLAEAMGVAAIRGQGGNAACSYVVNLNDLERVV